jgi:hypothetical protein
MKIASIHRKALICLFTALSVCLLVAGTVYGQTEKLGIVKYTPPKGWTKTLKENVVAFSVRDQATGGFCIITVYGATPGTGNPQSDFKREWNNLVVKGLNAEPNPKTETQTQEGWTATAGGAAAEFQGTRAVAFLTVISGFGKIVSVLGVFNDEAYMTQLAAFASSIEFDKIAAAVPPPREESLPPADAAAMHAATLVREFETNEVRATQGYVGKRMRIHGTVDSIVIGKDGRPVLTFKSSISTYGNARCLFGKSQSSRVSALNAHDEATVEGTVRGWQGGYDGAKVFVLLEDCVVP